jgi:hypothetical protein
MTPQLLQLGDRTVTFYAMSAEGAKALDTKLRAFEPRLPKDIAVVREQTAAAP